METPKMLDARARLGFAMEPIAPDSITPEKLPTPWLADSEWLLEELAKAREDALRLPWSVGNASNINSVVDRLWRLEQNLRYLLHLHRDGQRAFAKQAAKANQKTAKRVREAIPEHRQNHGTLILQAPYRRASRGDMEPKERDSSVQVVR